MKPNKPNGKGAKGKKAAQVKKAGFFQKNVRWILVGMIVVSFAFNYSKLFDPKPDTNGDNLYYYMLAYTLSQGKGYVTDIGPVPQPHVHFPPGYPAFMSLFMMVFPDNIIVMKVLNGLLLLASLLLLFRITRKAGGQMGMYAGAAACILATFHPEVMRYATVMMSEMLYMCITLGVVAICLDLDLKKVRQKDWKQIVMLVGLCLLVAYAYLVRTIGTTLLLAVLLTFGVNAVKKFIHRKEEGKAWLGQLAVCLLVFASFLIAREGWELRNRQVSPGYKGSYSNNFMAKVPNGSQQMATVHDWSSRIGMNLKMFSAIFIPKSVLSPDDATMTAQEAFNSIKPVNWVEGILMIALIVFGLLSLKGAALLVISYVVITFGVLMLYPEWFAGIRYFVPLMPILIVGAVLGFIRLVGLVTGRSRKRWVSFALPVLLLVVLVGIMAPRYYKDQEEYRQWASYKSYTDFPEAHPVCQYVKACEHFISMPQNIIVATRKPELFYVFSKHHHAVMVSAAEPEAMLRQLTAEKANFIILDNMYSQTYKAIVRTMQAAPDNLVPIKVFKGVEKDTFILRFVPLQ
jgi:hypothetical protein